MNKEEALKFFGQEFEEINGKEWIGSTESGFFRFTLEGEDDLYFKPKQKFPIVFEGEYSSFLVFEDGRIEIVGAKFIYDSLPALYKAVEKSKELRGEYNEY